MAGADFIKTSTGKSYYATLPVSWSVTRAIREYAQATGMAVGFKPAGGIRTAKQSLEWLSLMKRSSADSWLKAELFRFGASGMLADIERQLEHQATGAIRRIIAIRLLRGEDPDSMTRQTRRSE